VRIGLFTPDRAFYQVCESQIGRLKEPALKLADLVTHELLATVKDATPKVHAKKGPTLSISPQILPALSIDLNACSLDFDLCRTLLLLAHAGVRIGLFTPGQAFEVVARKQIAALKEPATKVVGLVTEELQKTLNDGLQKVHAVKLELRGREASPRSSSRGGEGFLRLSNTSTRFFNLFSLAFHLYPTKFLASPH